MCAVTEAVTQEEGLERLVQLIKKKFKTKDMDYWSEVPCAKTAPEGSEVIEIVFRPKK